MARELRRRPIPRCVKEKAVDNYYDRVTIGKKRVI